MVKHGFKVYDGSSQRSIGGQIVRPPTSEPLRLAFSYPSVKELKDFCKCQIMEKLLQNYEDARLEEEQMLGVFFDPERGVEFHAYDNEGDFLKGMDAIKRLHTDLQLRFIFYMNEPICSVLEPREIAKIKSEKDLLQKLREISLLEGFDYPFPPDQDQRIEKVTKMKKPSNVLMLDNFRN